MDRLRKVANYFADDEPGFGKLFDVDRIIMRILFINMFDECFLKEPVRTPIFVFNTACAILTFFTSFIHMCRYRGVPASTILSISAMFCSVEVVMKLCSMAYGRKRIIKMIDTVLGDLLYDAGPMERQIFLKHRKVAKNLMYVTFVSYPATALLLLSYPMLINDEERKLPMGYSIPFVDYHQQPWYVVNYSVIALQSYFCIGWFIGLDIPFYIFVCYSNATLDVLMEYLKQVDESDDTEEQRTVIKKVLEIHSRLSDFIRDCSNFYSEIYLFQVLCSVGLICVSLFHIQLELINGSYGMLLTNIGKMWLFCYCGEMVVTKAAEFRNSVYSSNWYRLWSKRDLQDIHYLLMNSQRLFGFSIGGCAFLSFNTFTSIMKTAYSCNTFLHNVLK